MAMAMAISAASAALLPRQSTSATPAHHSTQPSPSASLTFSDSVRLFAGTRPGRGGAVRCYARPLRPVEERFRILVERNVDEARLKELGVMRWPKWESDLCAYDHEWTVDEQVYVVKGSVRVIPEDCEDCAYFYAGDLVRFPKWFAATLSFDGEYEQRYRFRAYGDD